MATLLNYAFHLPIGTMILVINLPLLIAAWYKCGAAFTVRTLIVTVLSSAIIDGTARFLPPFRGDKILVALFGGVRPRGAARWWPACWSAVCVISPFAG